MTLSGYPLRDKAPDTTHSTIVVLAVAALTAATETLPPCEVRIGLGRTPVDGAGEASDGGLVRIKTVELA